MPTLTVSPPVAASLAMGAALAEAAALLSSAGLGGSALLQPRAPNCTNTASILSHRRMTASLVRPLSRGTAQTVSRPLFPHLVASINLGRMERLNRPAPLFAPRRGARRWPEHRFRCAPA